MDAPPFAEIRIEPVGGLPELAQAVTRALETARASGARRLLLDLSAIRMRPPSVGQRHAVATEWARAAGGELVVAVVVYGELIDVDRFGVMVAAAGGLHSEVFEHEADARAWLARQPVPGSGP